MGKNKCKRSHFSGSILVFSTSKSPDGSRKPENQLLGSYGCWGFRLPHARTGGVLIVAQRRVKHTGTIFYVVRQNRLHPRERVHFIRDQRKDTKQIHGGGGSLHSNSTPSSLVALAAAAMAARLLPLLLSTFSLYSSHSHPSLLSHFAPSRMPINRQVWWLLFFNNSSCTWVDTFVNGGCNYH